MSPVTSFQIAVPRPGLLEITGKVEKIVRSAELSEGICTVFIPHTSASLTIQENADPSVARDLEHWFQKAIRSTPTPPRDPTTCRPTSRRH